MSEDTALGRSLARWEATAADVPGAWKEKRRLAAAMRVVISRLVESDAPEAELAAAADGLERYAALLATHPRPNRYEGWSETSPAGDTGGFFDHSPLIGLSNPLSPPIELRAEPDRRSVSGRADFGSAYEGPPGCVHGGYVAAAFDEVLGFANALSGTPGMTGTLTVRYRRPDAAAHRAALRGAAATAARAARSSRRGSSSPATHSAPKPRACSSRSQFERFRALFEERQKREAEELAAQLRP